MSGPNKPPEMTTKIDKESCLWLVPPSQMVTILQMLLDGTINRAGAREVMDAIYQRNYQRCIDAGIAFV